MKGFVKLYGSILTSSVWVEPDHIFRVWITMLVLADKDGLVEGTAPGLANIARVSLNDCVEALEKFKQPDPHSRSKNDDGRRIEEVDGGWRLIAEDAIRAYLESLRKDDLPVPADKPPLKEQIRVFVSEPAA